MFAQHQVRLNDLVSCSSRLFHAFDSVVLLSQGRTLYSGRGGLLPAKHFERIRESDVTQGGESEIPEYEQGYNVADYLLEIASAPPVRLHSWSPGVEGSAKRSHGSAGSLVADEKPGSSVDAEALANRNKKFEGSYATTFLTQFQVLCGREWKIIRR